MRGAVGAIGVPRTCGDSFSERPAAEFLQGRAFERRRGAARRLQTAASLEIFTVEVRPPVAKELTRQIAVPLFMWRGTDNRGVAGDLARVPPSAKGAEGAPGGAAKPPFSTSWT